MSICAQSHHFRTGLTFRYFKIEKNAIFEKSVRFENGDFVRKYSLRQGLYVYFSLLQVLESGFDLLIDILGGVKD